MTLTPALKDLIAASVKVAADASNSKGPNVADRTLVKRSYIDDLRTALDKTGFGGDWRMLHDLVRDEERQPEGVH